MIGHLFVLASLLVAGGCLNSCPDGYTYDSVSKTCQLETPLPTCPLDQETPLYFPHEVYCSKFYSCYHGYVVELSCPPNTEFNQALGVCDWISATGCSSMTTPGSGTTDVPMTTTKAPATEAPTTEAPTTEVPTTEAPTTEAPTTEAPTTEAPTTEAPTTEAPTTEAPTTEAPTTNAPTTEAPTTEAPTTDAPETTTVVLPTPSPNICPQNTTGIVVLPHPDSCQLFYVCFNGEPSIYECSDHEEFDPEVNHCVPISSNGCTASKPTTTPEPTTTEATTEPPKTGPCKPNDPTVTIVAHETDCKKFYVCFMGSGTEYSCLGNNTEFDPNTSKCETISGTGCTASQNSTTSVPTTTTEKITTQLPTTTELVTEPATTTEVVTEEPETTTMIEVTTTKKPMPTTVAPEPTTIVVPTPPSNKCPLNSTSIAVIPHESDCQKFYVCFGGAAVEYNCDKNFEFNPTQMVCVPISSNGCIASQMTTTTEAAISGPCKPNDNNISAVPHETDCHKFYICFMGIGTEYSCENKEFEFDPIQQICVPASESGCSTKKSWIYNIFKMMY